VSVSIKLTQRLRDRVHYTTRNDMRRAEHEVRRNRRLIRMFSCVVASHALCWIPLNLFNLADHPLDLYGLFDTYYNFTFLLAHVLAMSSIIYNPILYSWFNEKFRLQFMNMCSCITQHYVRNKQRDSSSEPPTRTGMANHVSMIPLIEVTCEPTDVPLD
jgi:hypothetical protein